MTPQLFPYQKEGAAFLATQDTAFLADQMGLGKSAQAINAALLRNATRVLIVCPAGVRINWAREVAKFAGAGTPVAVITTGKTKVPSRGWVVVGYDLLRNAKVHDTLRGQAWDALVLDEAHYLKNGGAKRTHAVYGPQGLVHCAAATWALSGTPAPNHAGEMYSHLRALRPDLLANGQGGTSSYFDFLYHFCVVRETDYGPKVVAGRNYEELRGLLKPFLLRRETANVLPDLPAIRMEDMPVEAEPAALKELLQDDAYAELQAAFDADGVPSESEEITRMRRLIGLAKVKGVAEFVREAIESGQLSKIVLFAIHRDVIAALHGMLADLGVVVVHGGVHATQRQDAVDQFQTEPSVRIFIGQVVAAGTGITLTAANEVVFAELSWVPAENAQAASRVHRIGQTKNSVLIRFATLAESVDEIVVSTLRRKTAMLTEIFRQETPPQ